MELFHFPLMCMGKTLELKHFCEETLKKVLIMESRKRKRVSALGDKNFLINKRAYDPKAKFLRPAVTVKAARGPY